MRRSTGELMRGRHNRVRRGGFSLVEVAVTTTIVGVGVTALLLSVGSGTKVNAGASELTQAVFLAQEIREWTIKLPFSDPDLADQGKPPGSDGSDPQVFVDDLDDLMGVTYSPPRDGRGLAITSAIGWAQRITITWRDPDNLASIVGDGATDVVYVQVDILHRERCVYTTGWIVARR